MQHLKHNSIGIATEHKTKTITKTRHIDDLKGWKRVGYYGSYSIFAKGELRRLVNITTRELITEYLIPKRNCNA